MREEKKLGFNEEIGKRFNQLPARVTGGLLTSITSGWDIMDDGTKSVAISMVAQNAPAVLALLLCTGKLFVGTQKPFLRL